MTIPIIAHRTCPLHAPENSIAGIRKAAELGADGVEIDLRRSLDGVPFLMHDRSPRRTTWLPGPCSLYPAFVLRRVRLRGSQERIPTFDEALAALPEGLLFAIEIKDASLAARTLRSVRRFGVEARSMMWSYRDEAVRYFVENAPAMSISLLRDETDPESLSRFLDDALRLHARVIHPHWDAVTPQLCGEAHDRGLLVYSMNRDLESVARKVAAGLDAIITDHPVEVRDILSAAPARRERSPA